MLQAFVPRALGTAWAAYCVQPTEPILQNGWQGPGSLVQTPSALPAVVDGTVHPLSAYTLSFLKRMFTFDSALRVIFSQAVPTASTTLQAMRK